MKFALPFFGLLGITTAASKWGDYTGPGTLDEPPTGLSLTQAQYDVFMGVIGVMEESMGDDYFEPLYNMTVDQRYDAELASFMVGHYVTETFRSVLAGLADAQPAA